MHLRLSNDDLSVALVQKPSLYNRNDAEIKTISEAAEATQVHYTFFQNLIVLPYGYEHCKTNRF